MISSKEYNSLLLNSLSIIPELKKVLPDNEFLLGVLKRFDEIRSGHRKIQTEWGQFRIYPRHNTARLKEAIEIMLQLCKQWGIDPIFPFPNDANLNEATWEDFRKIAYVARYFYKGVEITGIIEF